MHNPPAFSGHRYTRGYTLIEMSIVVLVVGLIVGGVLVGQEMMHSARVKATISQLQGYQNAINAFQTKYNGNLPGDMRGRDAAQFGFVARAGTIGRGDGNGVIDGFWYAGGVVQGGVQNGEVLLFWRDLSQSQLIQESFITATDAADWAPKNSYTLLQLYFPESKLGGNSFINVYADLNGINYFQLSYLSNDPNGGGGGFSGAGNLYARPKIPVDDSYSIDNKMDDGKPTSGNVQAKYGDDAPHPLEYKQAPNAAAPSATTCYDTTSNNYTISNGSALNCALSIEINK